MAHDLSRALAGVSGILVTPFDADGDIAPALQGPVVERAIAAGVHVLTANGNTGEFYGLTTDEAVAMVGAAARHVAGRVPLVAGVGRGIRDACRLAEASAAAGADALMIHQPPDPFVAPRGIADYIRAVQEAGNGLPLILYLRNDAIGTAAIADICAIPGVAGVKWATPNPMIPCSKQLSSGELRAKDQAIPGATKNVIRVSRSANPTGIKANANRQKPRTPKAILRVIEERGALTRFDFAGLVATYFVRMAYGASCRFLIYGKTTHLNPVNRILWAIGT